MKYWQMVLLLIVLFIGFMALVYYVASTEPIYVMEENV